MRFRKIANNILNTLIGSRPSFATTDVKIGQNVKFGKNVTFNCKRVRIGDGVVFHNNITVNCDEFEIGDYGTVYDGCFFPGPGSVKIGHNFWMGTTAIVDGKAGTTIGHNTGIGAHSQLWTHMVYGDVMFGCQFHSQKPLVVGQDVWLVGHCLVSPVTIGDRSMALIGSLITKDMLPDRTYAGSPAQDITEKFGTQFKITSLESRLEYLQERFQAFENHHGLTYSINQHAHIVTTESEMKSTPQNITAFNVADRTYTKRNTPLEHQLMRFLLPDAKFIPYGE